jgi:hypothetical protein
MNANHRSDEHFHSTLTTHSILFEINPGMVLGNSRPIGDPGGVLAIISPFSLQIDEI